MILFSVCCPGSIDVEVGKKLIMDTIVTSVTSAGNPSVVATEKQNSAGVHVGLKLSHFRSIVAAFLLMASL